MRQLTLFLFVLLGVLNSFAVTPSRVVITVDPFPVFTIYSEDQFRSHVVISVYDSAGNPVPENTPIVISTYRASGYLYDTLFSAQQFKVSYDPSYINRYYFWTDAQGKVQAEYAGRVSVSPGDTLTVYVNAHAVRFSDPDDPQTASSTGSNLLDEAASQAPFLLVSLSTYHATVYGRDGDYYVTEVYDAAHIDSTRMKITFFDAAGRPVPEHTPVGISYVYPNIWGTLEGNEILQRDTVPATTGFAEERKYYFRTDANGEIEFIYVPANTGYAILGQDKSLHPWHSWYEQNKDYYASREEAFAYWENARTVPMIVRGARYTDGEWRMGATLSLEKGHLPVLVGPSLVRIVTYGEDFNSRYLFTNKNRVERATVFIELQNDLERPVPAGTPLALVNAVITADASGTCYPFIHGRIFQNSPYPVEYDANECGDDNFWAIVRMGEWGEVELRVEPPYASLRSEIPHWGNYNDPYLDPAFHQRGHIKMRLTMTDDTELPVLTSAYTAEISFEPPFLGPGKIFSRAKIQVLDTQQRPVPRGTLLDLRVDKGAVYGTETGTAFIQVHVGEYGWMTVPYVSPTRSVLAKISATLEVGKSIEDPWGQGYKPILGSATIHMEGAAYSPIDPSISKLIFGRDLSDILADLNPLKALGTMREMAERAQEAREARIRLLRLAASSDATDEELQQAYNDFKQKFGALAETIGWFIQDVPGTSFDPSLPVTAQSTVSDILEKGFRRYYQKKIMKKFATELQNQVQDFISQHGITELFNIYKPLNNQRRLNNAQILLGDNLQIELLTPLHFMPGETQMFEVYAFRFRVTGFKQKRADSIFQVTDQYPLSAYLFPPEMLETIAPGQPVITPGIMEVAAIVDSQTVEFVALGIISSDASIMPDLVSEAMLADTADTSLTWLDGNGVYLSATNLDFTANAVDSVQLFLLPLPPPNPVDQSDSTVIHYAYAFGHLTMPDSNIAPLTLNGDATFLIDVTTIYPDSSKLPETFVPYRYDETTDRWIELPRLPGYDSTVVAFTINQTGIYGVGGKTAEVPITGIHQDASPGVPQSVVLMPNYPNPFNGGTWIRYYLPRGQRVSLTVYDVQGRRIRTLVDDRQPAGWHQVRWSGNNQQGVPVSSGIYFYELKTGEYRLVRKMMFVQ